MSKKVMFQVTKLQIVNREDLTICKNKMIINQKNDKNKLNQKYKITIFLN